EGVMRLPRLEQNVPAFAHVLRDVVEVNKRQHALPGIAVEDDQLEFADLLLKQLAGRKRDQRQLVDRRAVLLFRRAQNGKVHQIDGSIRLEQVTPRALA